MGKRIDALMESVAARLAPAILAIAVSLFWLFSLCVPSEEAVKVRNSLVARMGEIGDFQWTPTQVPGTYLQDSRRATEQFRETLVKLRGGITEPEHSELASALSIAGHLMGAVSRQDGPIQSTVGEAYREIVQGGRGYCADFTQVFNAMAITAGLQVREWSIAFDTFGSGHAFNEIYDNSRGKWILVDSFHSLYFVDPVGREPLSVLETHDRLMGLGANAGLEIVAIGDKAIPFRSDALALDYYRRGMPQLAMLWGNNVFDYERHWLVRAGGKLGRSVEQLAAIITGTYPKLMIYPEGVSERDVRALFRRRDHFQLALGSAAISSLLLIGQIIAFRRSRLRLKPVNQ